MPRHKRLPRLDELCLARFSSLVARTCTQLETTSSTTMSTDKAVFSACLRRLPTVLLERLLPRVLQSMATSLRRHRSHKGLLTALEVLPQKALTKLDLASLFADVRLTGSTNSQCKSLLISVLSDLPKLTRLTLVSKCNDAMLFQLAKNCPSLEHLHVPMSDVTDRGVAALCGLSWEGKEFPGCPDLQQLGLINCFGVSVKGAACALRHLDKLTSLSFDKLADAVETLAKVDGDFLTGKRTLKVTHLDQFSEFYDFSAQPDAIPIIKKACPLLKSLRFYVSDEGCESLAVFPDIVHLQIETDDLGTGFRTLISNYANLSTLQLTFRSMSHEHLVLIAESCPNLSVLRLIGYDVAGSAQLVPKSKYFTSLKVLDLRMVTQDDIPYEELEDGYLGGRFTPELVNFLVTPALDLEELTISAVADFFSQAFFMELLLKNPLSQLRKLVVSVSQSPGLNAEALMAILHSLPELTIMGVTRWKMNAKEMGGIIAEMKAKNYDITFT